MAKKPVFFIFERREMRVLGLAVFVFAMLTFTVGLHYGKQMIRRESVLNPATKSALKTGTDQVPSRLELQEQARDLNTAAQEFSHRALKDEVKKTGLKLNKSYQVNLPRKTASVKGGATTLDKFALQIGSFGSEEEARQHIRKYVQNGLNPFLREGPDSGVKGTKHFRVYLGGFNSRKQAEEAGTRYKKSQIIPSYVVTQAQ